MLSQSLSPPTRISPPVSTSICRVLFIPLHSSPDRSVYTVQISQLNIWENCKLYLSKGMHIQSIGKICSGWHLQGSYLSAAPIDSYKNREAQTRSTWNEIWTPQKWKISQMKQLDKGLFDQNTHFRPDKMLKKHHFMKCATNRSPLRLV